MNKNFYKKFFPKKLFYKIFFTGILKIFDKVEIFFSRVRKIYFSESETKKFFKILKIFLIPSKTRVICTGKPLRRLAHCLRI